MIAGIPENTSPREIGEREAVAVVRLGLSANQYGAVALASVRTQPHRGRERTSLQES